MATFPTLTPSSRTFSPGEYPHSSFTGMSGVQSRVRNSNVMLSSQLRLTFVAITEAQMLSILSHYQGQRGSFESFSLPSAIFSGVTSSDFQLSGYGWRYIDPPNVIDRMCADAYDVELTLETVPPEGTALAGLSSVIIATLAAGVPLSTNGLSITVTTSIMIGGATASGLAETVTATLTAGAGSGAVGAAGLSQTVWIGLTTQARALTSTVTVSLAAGAGSGNATVPSYRYYRLNNFANTALNGDTLDFGEIELYNGNTKHTGITASANFNFNNTDASPLVDGITSLSTRAFRSGWSNGQATAAITLDLGSSKPVTHVKIFSIFDQPRFPASFTLSGSSDNATFTTIGTITVGTSFTNLGGNSYSSAKVAV